MNLLAVCQVWVISVLLAEYFFPKSGFEFHPEGEALEERVQISHLGGLMYETGRGSSLTFAKNSPACVDFPPSGPEQRPHHVCFAFLEFFQAHGGVGRFGFPISGNAKPLSISSAGVTG